jgi:uncharacterized membrane protein YcgQ (UPF0703/DUF1980 family)
LKVVILAPSSLSESHPDLKPLSWVEVTGIIQFSKIRDREEYVPILQVEDNKDIVLSTPEPNIYIQ